jgi:hypothetical protein
MRPGQGYATCDSRVPRRWSASSGCRDALRPGLGHADRVALPGVVAGRVAALRDLVVRLTAEGDDAGLRRLADGDADEYDDDVAYVVRARPILDGVP